MSLTMINTATRLYWKRFSNYSIPLLCWNCKTSCIDWHFFCLHNSLYVHATKHTTQALQYKRISRLYTCLYVYYSSPLIFFLLPKSEYQIWVFIVTGFCKAFQGFFERNSSSNFVEYSGRYIGSTALRYLYEEIVCADTLPPFQDGSSYSFLCRL